MARAITQKIKSYSVVTPEEASRKPSVFVDDPDRHLKLGTVPKPVAASLRWAKRPDLVEGNDSRTYVIRGPSTGSRSTSVTCRMAMPNLSRFGSRATPRRGGSLPWPSR